jgi:rhamnogalacturonan endolyase
MKSLAPTLSTLFCAMCLATCSSMAASPLGGFTLIKGGEFKVGKGAAQNGHLVRVEDFEILDHPLTNGEYRVFIEETGYRAPVHWIEGKVPAGKEDYPVIFVSRRDVDAFMAWLTKKEGRICRLPTSAEFEYAARGGATGRTYPWGDEAPQGKANYDADGNRRFDRWQDYLQPARWGAQNGYGLYGMAGNVCQWTIDLPEPATVGYQYRIEDLSELGHSAMGGSWAKSKTFLTCGDRVGFSPGNRHPDLGFRPVRQPVGSDWTVTARKLCGISRGGGEIQLGWALLQGDMAATRFNVYRAGERGQAGFRVNKEPISDCTTLVDSHLKEGSRYQYYVRPVDASGKEGPRSEWVGVAADADAGGIVTSFKPLFQRGNLVPVFGDLDGDGTLDCVIRMDNGNSETSQDPGLPVQLEAFTSYGRSLWRKDICRHDHCYGNANNVPFVVWDMDGDGKAEVVTRLQIGDEVFVAILNGMTGAVLQKTPWPAMVSDFSKSSTRIHIAIAYLDGKHPAVVTQTGLYENEVIGAFDAQLHRLWQFDSFKETNGSGGHKIEVADVDGDGRQEVFDGTTCLNCDGTLRWSIYKMHPDIVSIHHYLPDRPGLQVFYIVESSPHAGAYLVDAATGQILWKSNREDDPRWTHGHYGWSADIWAGSPGMECVSNRAGHHDKNLVLFSAEGRILCEPFPVGWTPLQWNADPTRDLIHAHDFCVGKFNGKEIVAQQEGNPQPPSGSDLLMVADLYGDFRDELVLTRTGEKGEKFISVLTAVAPMHHKFLAATETLDYRLWLARNMGGGYPSIYSQPLLEPSEK